MYLTGNSHIYPLGFRFSIAFVHFGKIIWYNVIRKTLFHDLRSFPKITLHFTEAISFRLLTKTILKEEINPANFLEDTTLTSQIS
jgi:hypothetical protein